MKIVKLYSAQFDKFATSHKYRNYFQSSMYGNVMSKFGYRSQYLGIVNEYNKLIGATLIIYKEVFMKNKIAYAPRGILFNYENKDSILELVEKLKKVLGKQGFMLLRMDPYIPLTIRDYQGNIINFNNKGNESADFKRGYELGLSKKENAIEFYKNNPERLHLDCLEYRRKHNM